MLELLISEWEDLLNKSEYEPIHGTLKAKIALLVKYYQHADDIDAYFIMHGEFFSYMSDLLTHVKPSSQPYSQGHISQGYVGRGVP
jgi:hypothetical protein